MWKLVRSIVMFAGAVAVVVGVVGLFTVVSVSPNQNNVLCGSAVAPDLSQARAETGRGYPATPPAADVKVAHSDYVALCRGELTDRRIWTITVAGIGVLSIAGALTLGAVMRRVGSS